MKVRRKIKVAVLMGGRSPEHEISLISGREVVRNLDKKKYDVLPVVVSKNGKKWRLTSPKIVLALPDPLKGEFFDYESKYTESGAEEIVPARISKSLTKKIQGLAVKVYRAVGARGFGRVDFILKDNRHPVVLEINTIPGLTPMSLLPKAAKEAGYSYSGLLTAIIKYAL